MTSVSRSPTGSTDRDHPRGPGDRVRDHRFSGYTLPIELPPARAARIYLRRLLFIVEASAAVFAVIALAAFAGPIGAVSVLLTVAIVVAFVRASKVSLRIPAPTGRRLNKTRRVVTLALFIFLPAFTAVASVPSAFNHDGLRTQLFFLAGTSLLGLALLGLHQALRADEAIALWVGESRIAAMLARTAHPMVIALGNVTAASNEPERQEHLKALISKAIGLAKTMTGRTGSRSSRTRSMFYHLDHDDRLTLWEHVGDYGEPREHFLSSESENDRGIVELAKADTALFVRDLDEASPIYFANPKGRPYKSLISVPVRAGSKSFGVLMIDAEDPGGLTEVDVGYAVLIAGVLGAGLAAADTSPGTSTPADARYAAEVNETFDSVFSAKPQGAEVYFNIIPEEDRNFLASQITLVDYFNLVETLADLRAKRRMGILDWSGPFADVEHVKRWLSRAGIS